MSEDQWNKGLIEYLMGHIISMRRKGSSWYRVGDSIADVCIAYEKAVDMLRMDDQYE